MADKSMCARLAKHEINWWKAHHRKDNNSFVKEMAELYKLQFRLPQEKALQAVKLRVQAAREHDLAEEFEDSGKQIEADKHWKNAEEFLKEHFKILRQAKQ